MSTTWATNPSRAAARALRAARAARAAASAGGGVTLIVGPASSSAIVIVAVARRAAAHELQARPPSTRCTRSLPPLSPGHLLGTDQFGRDIFSRILYGGRIDLLIAFGATSVTLVVGTVIGLRPGYFGGWVDSVIMRIVDLFFAFPFLVLVIAIVAMLGPSIFNMFVAIWLTSWISYARITRGHTLVAKRQEYVLAARALGYRHRPRDAPPHPAERRLLRDHLRDGRRGREHPAGRVARLPRPRRAAAVAGVGRR